MTKILIWPRSNLIFLGISKILKKRIDCDLFLAVDDNNTSKKFYLNQDIVNFKKIWFYGDYVNKKFDDVDLNYLKKFEIKYDINLWNIIYSDRVFYNHNIYHTFSKNEILKIVQYSCKFFEHLLNESDPDILIMEPDAFHQDVILKAMCKKLSIKILTIFSLRIGKRIMISSEPDHLDNQLNKNNFTELKSFNTLLQNSLEYSKAQKFLFKNHKVDIKKQVSAYVRFLTNRNIKNYSKFFSNYGKNKLKLFYYPSLYLLKSYFRLNYLNKISMKKLPKNKKFVYFSLHFQPERSTLIQAAYWTNQLEIIQHIAKSIPIDYVLCVKEHPLMKNTHWHKSSFYKQMISIPNVQLIHHSIPNNECVQKSSLVITITGSSSLESLFHKKPSIVFADTMYSNLSDVHKIINLTDLSKLIKTCINSKVSLKDLNQFVYSIEKNSIEFELPLLYFEILHKFQSNGFLSISSISISDFKNFLNEKEKSFEIITDEFVHRF